MKIITGILALIVGIVFTLKDVGVLGGWNFWGIQPWSIAFLLAGLACILKKCCE